MVGAEKVTVVSPEAEYYICLTALELWGLLCSLNSEQNDWADLQSHFKTKGMVSPPPPRPCAHLHTYPNAFLLSVGQALNKHMSRSALMISVQHVSHVKKKSFFGLSHLALIIVSYIPHLNLDYSN